MFWTQKKADEVEKAHPSGEIIVSSGVSPSGKYHVGTLREVLTADAVAMELKKRGRDVKHIHVVDDLDFLRKIPFGLDSSFEQYLGIPLCSVPSPVDGYNSYADYYLADFLPNLKILGVDAEIVRAHQKYQAGYFAPAIEKTLINIQDTKYCLESVSGRKLDEQWSPIQIIEGKYLKKRPFIAINTDNNTIQYLDKNNNPAEIKYDGGLVKLDWRLDWPARWWLMKVDFEPFGREHGTKGGSYDTGKALVKKVFGGEPPVPTMYEFINRAGDTKKMSKSAGNTVTITDLLNILPPEIVRYFVLRFSPGKQLVFDQNEGVVRLIDEYAELLAKPDKTPEDKTLIDICSSNLEKNTISNIPFSHLVACYQAALKDPQQTIELIKLTEHSAVAEDQKNIIIDELKYIDNWLEKWASEDVKFSLQQSVNPDDFDNIQKQFLSSLAQKITNAPKEADGEWFHKAIYEFKSDDMPPKFLFTTLYKVLIGKDAGPRAGWFLSILPRDWLIARLKLVK